MLTVLLVLHLLTAIFLVSLILMQRSEGGALSGLGGGSGANSFLNARGKGNLLTRTTAILATIFFITSISLSLYHNHSEVKAVSILDTAPAEENKVALDIPAVPTAEADENAAVDEETAAEEAKTEETVAPVEEETTAPAEEETKPAEETAVEETTAPAEEKTEAAEETPVAEESEAKVETKAEAEAPAEAEPETKPEVPVAE